MEPSKTGALAGDEEVGEGAERGGGTAEIYGTVHGLSSVDQIDEVVKRLFLTEITNNDVTKKQIADLLICVANDLDLR